MTGVDIQIDGERHSQSVTVAEVLANGTELLTQLGMESPRLDAELLLGKALGLPREKLYVNYGSKIDAGHHELYLSLLQRRGRREPTAYITGHREFWSLDFRLTPAVLVPRPETELVVEETLRQINILKRNHEPLRANSKFRILDLGTGCGAIAVSLAKERNDLEIWATDLCPDALDIAQSNARLHGVQDQIHFVQGDLFEPLVKQTLYFNGIVSNPPYVNQREMEHLCPEVQWEPKLALEAGPDGLDLYRRIIPHGHRYLQDKGFMVLEMGSEQGSALRSLFSAVGKYSEISIQQDYTGRNRVITAKKGHSSPTTTYKR